MIVPGQSVVWESLGTPGRFFYGRVLSVYAGEIFGSGYIVVRDRHFKQPITVALKRVMELNNKKIDTAPRPLLIS